MAQNNSDTSKTIQSPYDYQEAVSRLGSETLLKKVAFMFLTNSPALIEEMKRGLDEGDDTLLERSAHTLVSSIAYFAAEPATQAARHLETLGREHRIDEAPEAYRNLTAEVSRLRDALTELLPEEGIPRES